MALSNKPKRKTEKAPAVDKLLLPATGVVLALLVFYFMKGIMKTEIPRIDPTDELALREVFFGEGEGKNYVVLCNSIPTDRISKNLPISSVFMDAQSDVKFAQFVMIDCEHTLPSGKTIADRFHIDLKKRPSIFVSGKVGPPKQVPTQVLKTGNMLAKYLSSMLEPHAAKVENVKDLKMKCLDKEWCGLLLKGGTPENHVKNTVKNLLTKYENIHFASVDSTSLFLTNLEEYIPEYQKGKHRFVLFKKVSGGLAAGTDGKEAQGRLITSIYPLDGYDISLNAISAIIDSATINHDRMKKIPSLPQVKVRTKKLEEQEIQKRQRAQRRSEESKRPSESQREFSANDGTKEGRRLEREKRRDEHRKANPNYREKTPEEIAEIERQRRKRMQEEAENWNIRDADAPPEGDVVDEAFEEDLDAGSADDDFEDDNNIDESEDEIFDLD